VPDEITSVGRLLNIPPLPDVPEPLRGRSVVVVEAIYIGDEAERAPSSSRRFGRSSLTSTRSRPSRRRR